MRLPRAGGTETRGLFLACRLLKLRQIGEDFGAVFFGVDAEIGFANDAGGIDEKGVAGGKFGDAEIDERVVGRRNCIFRVGKQFEAEAFLGAEFLMGRFVLNAHS